ncbi:MAG: hypothetical protein ACE5OZ_00980 [Candidatus Heimdallarchaeota archaeon]
MSGENSQNISNGDVCIKLLSQILRDIEKAKCQSRNRLIEERNLRFLTGVFIQLICFYIILLIYLTQDFGQQIEFGTLLLISLVIPTILFHAWQWPVRDKIETDNKICPLEKATKDLRTRVKGYIKSGEFKGALFREVIFQISGLAAQVNQVLTISHSPSISIIRRDW